MILFNNHQNKNHQNNNHQNKNHQNDKYNKIKNVSESNKMLINIIKNNNPFSIVRMGWGPETTLTVSYMYHNFFNENELHPFYKTLYNAGIYTKNKDLNMIKLFCKYYDKAIKESDMILSFSKTDKSISYCQNLYASNYRKNQLDHTVLNPTNIIIKNETPWTHYLKGKKILIINPFIQSIKKQLDNNFKLMHNNIFLENQHFCFYKPFQTIAGNHIHENWFETFKIMCREIQNIDFDIALLSCGGYGLPLCSFIKEYLNKQAIYVGGELQMWFGVLGKRWGENLFWQEIIKNCPSTFIRPSGDEICKNLNTIEGGCYW